MSRWNNLLQPDEQIVWQGRPAPRAYTFRNWRWSMQAIAGLAMVLFFRQGTGPLQVDYAVDRWWTWAGLLVGLWAGVGHLLWARLEWEHVFYLLTDQRLVTVSGLWGQHCRELPLPELEEVEQHAIGEALATVKVTGGGRRLILHCLEHPQLLVQPLSALARSASPRTVEAVDPAEGI